jgi:desampylase
VSDVVTLRVRLPTACLHQMQGHAQAAAPQEACGLLLGQAGEIQQVRPARNVAADPHRCFEIDAASLILAHKTARSEGLAVIGCYHSHPTGDVRASETDRVRIAQTPFIWVILSGDAWACHLATPQGFCTLEADLI